ncbi:MAG: helix-turn-helix domain-containing protein [Pyrinomonadaceae bacterium]
MNTEENHLVQQENHSLAMRLKRRAAWDGISLTHYRLGPGQLPEHHNKEHLITLSLNERCEGEIRLASGFRARAQNKGSVCVIPSGHPFTVNFEAESEHLAIFLDPSLVWRAAAESRVSNDMEVRESCAPSDPVINSIGLALLAELESENEGGRLYADSLANILALHLVRHYSTSGNGAPRFVGGLTGHKLRLVLEFIDANYARELNLTELAEVAGMSTFHFAREFKRATSTTPHQYLIKLRIERAKELLSRSEMPLVDVGFQAGFSHQSHFTRLFRRLTGTTPQSYRLRFQT